MQEFKEKFKVETLLIKKVGAWNISLRPAQTTIGSLVLSLDRSCPTMGNMLPKETAALSEAFEQIEALYANTFKPDKINYLALMMVDHQVHFHVIPRYKTPVEFQGKKYSDKDWPKPPDILTSLDFTPENLQDMRFLLCEGVGRNKF